MATPAKPWYVEFFARDYLRYWLGGENAPMVAPERTERETAFAVEALGLKDGASVLDLACGHGRHAVALARRGYRVAGIDLSDYHLRLARRAATKAGVEVEWVKADMRRIPRRFDGRFDAVINMFTAFGYLESDAEDQRVLDGVARALRPGGKFLLEFINRESLMRRYQERDWTEANGAVLLHKRHFDFVSGRNHDDVTVLEPGGRRRALHTVVRVYTLAELVAMMNRAGLRFVRVWGDLDGRELDINCRRLIAVADKRRGR